MLIIAIMPTNLLFDDYLSNNHYIERGKGGALVFESAVSLYKHLTIPL